VGIHRLPEVFYPLITEVSFEIMAQIRARAILPITAWFLLTSLGQLAKFRPENAILLQPISPRFEASAA
jgi:hypothetical protein